MITVPSVALVFGVPLPAATPTAQPALGNTSPASSAFVTKGRRFDELSEPNPESRDTFSKKPQRKEILLPGDALAAQERRSPPARSLNHHGL